MTLLTMNGALHGLTAGTAITTGNSAAMGTALSAVTLAGSGAVTAHANGVRFNDPSGTTNVARADWNGLLSDDQCSIEIEFDPCATPGSGEMRLATIRNPANTADVAFVQLLTTRQVRVYNNAVTSLWTMATALPSGAGSRVHVGVDLGAGTLEINVYTGSDGKSNTPVESKGPYAVNWNGATTVGGLRFGAITSATSWDQVLRNVRISDATAAPLGVIGGDPPPVVTLGADLAAEPGEAVDLTAAYVSGTTPTSWTWAHVSGLPVGLVGSGNKRSFAAPATYEGGTAVVGVTPAAGSNTGAQDTVNVTVAPQPMWARPADAGGVWSPVGRLQDLTALETFGLTASATTGLYDLTAGGDVRAFGTFRGTEYDVAPGTSLTESGTYPGLYEGI